jgi:hypothetical protein
LGEVATFRSGDDGRVNGSKRQVSVGRDEFGNPEPVDGADRLSEEAARSQVAEEADLGIWSESGLDEVRYLGDGQDGERRVARDALRSAERHSSW